MTVVVVFVVGEVFHPIDEPARAANQVVLLAVVDRLVVEGRRIQQRFDLGHQRIALARDVGDGGEEFAVGRVVARIDRLA